MSPEKREPQLICVKGADEGCNNAYYVVRIPDKEKNWIEYRFIGMSFICKCCEKPYIPKK